MENGDGEHRLGCPACRFVSRTCPPNCRLSVYFPAETESDFAKIKALRTGFDELRSYPTAKLRFTKAEAVVPTGACFSGTGRHLLVEALVEASFVPQKCTYDADSDFSDYEEFDFLVDGIESLALTDCLEDDQELQEPSGPTCAPCEGRGRRECPPDCLFAPYFPASRSEDYARVERFLGAETLIKVLKVLSPEDRISVVESVVHEAKTLAHRPAGNYIKAITENIVSEIVRVGSELERVTTELETHRASKFRKAAKFQDPQEGSSSKDDEPGESRAFHSGEKKENSTSGFDLRRLEIPSPEAKECVSPRSPFGWSFTVSSLAKTKKRKFR